MRNKIILLVLIFTGLTIQVHAEYRTNEFSIEPEISHIKYNEPNIIDWGQIGNVREAGTMYGVTASYKFHRRLMLGVEGTYESGTVDYTYINKGLGVSASMNGIPDTMYEIRGLGGWDFNKNSFTVTPYTGFGYRYLKDNGAGKFSSDGSFGYLRESNYYYLPVGVTLRKEIGKLWAVELNAEVDELLSGMQISHLNIVKGFPLLHNKQNHGYGSRGSIAFIRRGVVDFALVPYIRFWKIDDSEVDNGFLEPHNNSTEYGIKLRLTF